jgi:hypothetical protein
MIQSRAVPCTALALTLMLAACGEPATLLLTGDEPAAAAPAPAAPIAGAPGTMTLITGDRVILHAVTNDPPGIPQQVAHIAPKVIPGPGRSKIAFTIQQRHGEFTVMPQDMAALVASGQLDPQLFNVTRLIAAGFGDDKRRDLPLVVTSPRDAAGLVRQVASPGLQVERTLSSLHAVAVRQDKGAPSPLLAGLVAPTGIGTARAATPGATTKIWLDRPYKQVRDQGVAQIASPASGGACMDGSGVSDCPLSAILAGMERSVDQQGARIVNLNVALGDDPGDDPLEDAINQLSAERGTLFVAAAGRAGPRSAERALAAFDLTIRVLDTGGNVAGASLFLVGVDPGTDFVSDFITGPTTYHLGAGRYLVWTFDINGSAILVAPRYALAGDSELVMDGRLSRPLDVDVVGQDLALADLSWVVSDHQGAISLSVGGGALPIQAGQIGADAPPGEISGTASAMLVPTGEPTAPSAVYTIARFAPNQFFTGWKQTLRGRDFATVHARHAGAEGTTFTKSAGAIPPDNNSLSLLGVSYVGPFEATEHYYGPGFQWITALDQTADFGFSLAGESQLVTYRAGQTTTEAWNRAPLAPAFTGIRTGPFGVLGSPRREGDFVIAEPSLFSDQGSHPAHDGFTSFFDTSHARLLRNGVVIEDIDGLASPFPSFEASPESAEYRIEQEVTRSSDLFDLSTEVAAAWTFRTQHAEGDFEILPLPALRFSLDLDEHNQTHARALVLPVHVERVAGAPTPRIASIRVDVSFDDGASWARVPLIVLGADALGLIVHPPGATHVSLRGSTADVQGNSAEMKVIRAYGLAPR